MPFGWGSTWDVTGPLLVPIAAMLSPMPFGWGSTWNTGSPPLPPQESLVTNAFRLGVHLGLRAISAGIYRAKQSHQCLSAGGPLGTQSVNPNMSLGIIWSPMPFGWGSTWDWSSGSCRALDYAVTNAFRLGVHLGRSGNIRHQVSNRVTNAFRLGVHLGQDNRRDG